MSELAKMLADLDFMGVCAACCKRFENIEVELFGGDLGRKLETR